MNNDLMALNNILFEQIEKINDADVTGGDLEESIKRAKSINMLANTVINNAHLQLEAYQEFGRTDVSGMSKVLGIE